MNQDYNLTFSRHLNQGELALINISVLIVGMWYLISKNGADALPALALGFAILFSILVLPAVIVHTQYFLTNRNARFQIEYGKPEAVYEDIGQRIEFHFNDILLIEHFMTLPQKKKGMHLVAWTSYHYSKIVLRDGRSIYITSLLADEFSLPIENTKVQIHEVVFPNIKR